MPFNTTRKTVYKGVDTRLGFDVKNQDRKPVSLLNKTVMVNLMQVRRGEMILQRRAELVKPEVGFCELSIFGYDLTDVEPGIYQLSAQVYDNDGMATALYTDNNRSATIEVEILDGTFPTFFESTPLVFTEDTPGVWTSQAIKGNLQRNDSSVLHTIQIATTGFKGSFTAQGSLEYNTRGNFSPIRFIDSTLIVPFDGTNDIQGWNFKGSYRWVRIQYTPAVNNTGTVDRVLYRS